VHESIQEILLAGHHGTFIRYLFRSPSETPEKIPTQARYVGLSASNHECRLDSPGGNGRAFLLCHLQQGSLHVQESKKCGLRATFEASHPAAITRRADILDRKASQVMASNKFIPNRIFVVPVMLIAHSGQMEFLGQPSRKNVLTGDYIVYQ
jgi:hypothetical protein